MLGKKAVPIIVSVLLLASTSNMLLADSVTISVSIPKSTSIIFSHDSTSNAPELILSSNGHVSVIVQTPDGFTDSIETAERNLVVPLNKFPVSRAKRYTYTVM